jgi:putative phosphoesterase
MTASTRIGLISDVHASPDPLREALELFHRAGVDGVYCAGDIAGYGDRLDRVVELLQAADCRSIYGNHDLWYLEGPAGALDTRTSRYLAGLPAVVQQNIDGRTLYMVHASPPADYSEGIRLLDMHGEILPDQRQHWTERLQGFEADVLVVGHTHQIFAEWLGTTLVVNPGSTCFNHSCAVLSFPDLVFEVHSLSNRQAVKTWNWGVDQLGARSQKP